MNQERKEVKADNAFKNKLSLQKTLTGIKGLDEITEGGLPKGRPTLVCGGTGCGKTLLAMEFLVRGILDYNEPGVFMAFEETGAELKENVASLGFDLQKLQDEKKLKIDHVHIESNEIEESGDYDLEGLFVRLNYAIDSIGAKRVVLDTLESLFSGLTNTAILRSEFRRLFRWLKDKGVTAIITAESGEGALTRQGLEEYVSDCVILLTNQVVRQITTRRLRIVKYRGSTHGTNEYPYLIDSQGLSVLPLSSLRLEHDVSVNRVLTGIPSLDEMMGGKGFYEGSTILVTGSAGTGKTSIAASFAIECVRNNKRCLYFAFEESPQQILRNMSTIGLDFLPFFDNDTLQILASRPTLYGLEMHLLMMHKKIEEFKPEVVIVDPMTNLISAGDLIDVKGMLTRLIDHLKVNKITALFTALTHNLYLGDSTLEGISSLIDTLIQVRNIEIENELRRGLQIVKSRGMAHSNKIREFLLSDNGIVLTEWHKGNNN